jgi:hypothetical protein
MAPTQAAHRPLAIIFSLPELLLSLASWAEFADSRRESVLSGLLGRTISVDVVEQSINQQPGEKSCPCIG